jgi:vacuolar-type H+-ATPase subunit I/STV1
MKYIIALLAIAATLAIAQDGGLRHGGARLRELKERRAAEAVEEQRMAELTKELDAEQAERDLLAIVADLQRRVRELEERVAKLEATKTEARQ